MKCPRCKGKMRIKDYQKDNDGDGYMPCPTCEGEGTIEEDDEDDEINGMSKERYMACEILEIFEDFLASKGIEIPNKERDEYYKDNPEDKEEGAILFGSEYYSLEDEVTELLEKFKKEFKKKKKK